MTFTVKPKPGHDSRGQTAQAASVASGTALSAIPHPSSPRLPAEALSASQFGFSAETTPRSAKSLLSFCKKERSVKKRAKKIVVAKDQFETKHHAAVYDYLVNHQHVEDVVSGAYLAEYTDEGRPRKMVFDFLVVAKGGRRLAVVCRNSGNARAIRIELEAVRWAQAELATPLADDFLVLTEEDL